MWNSVFTIWEIRNNSNISRSVVGTLIFIYIYVHFSIIQIRIIFWKYPIHCRYHVTEIVYKVCCSLKNYLNRTFIKFQKFFSFFLNRKCMPRTKGLEISSKSLWQCCWWPGGPKWICCHEWHADVSQISHYVPIYRRVKIRLTCRILKETKWQSLMVWIKCIKAIM